MTRVRTHRQLSRLLAMIGFMVALSVCGFASSRGYSQQATASNDLSPTIKQELRIVWGGPSARHYLGTISISSGKLKCVRNLSTQSTAAASTISKDSTTIELASMESATFGGVDLAVEAPENSRIDIQIKDSSSSRVIDHHVSLLDLQQGTWIQPLDSIGNRIAIERQTYDKLRVHDSRSHRVLECGENWEMDVAGYRTGLAEGKYKLTATWVSSGGHSRSTDQSWPVEIDSTGSFEPVSISLQVPTAEGAHRVELSLTRHNIMHAIASHKPLLARSVEIVAFDPKSDTKQIAGWKPLLAVDTVAAVGAEDLGWLASFTNSSISGRSTDLHDLTSLSALALPEQLSRLMPLSRSVATYGKVTKSGQVEVREYFAGDSKEPTANQNCVSIAADGSLSIPLAVLRAGHPHRLRVELPADQTNHLTVLIKDSSNHETNPLCPQSSVVVRDSENQVRQTVTHDFVFWPQNESIEVVIASGHRSKPASVGKLLLESAELIKTSEIQPSQPLQSHGRTVAIYLDQPFLVDCLGAPRELDSPSGKSFESWATWQTVSERLVSQLQLAHANALVLTAATDAAALIPIESIPANVALDKATFFSDGRAPDGHDFLELLLRHFDRAGLKLIIEIDLNSGLALFLSRGETETDLFQTDVHGQTASVSRDAKLEPIADVRLLNPLNSKVQSTVAECIKELVQRYENHASFAGISLRLRANSPLVFGGQHLGYNADLLDRYSAKTGVALPKQSEQRSDLMKGPAGLGYLEWRAEALTEFYSRLARIVRTADSDANLYVNTIRLWEKGRPEQSRIQDPATLSNPLQFLLSFGLDVQRLAKVEGLVLAQGCVRPGWPSLSGRDWMQSPSYEAWSMNGSTSPEASFISHVPQAKTLASGRTLYVDSVEADSDARQVLVDQLWKSDLSVIAFGGWYPIWTQEPQISQLIDTVKSLPPTAMHDLPLLPVDSPVKIRKASFDGQTYLACINSSGLPGTLTLQISNAHEPNLQRLGQDETQPLGELESARRPQWNAGQVEFRVPAFDMVAWVSDSPLEIASADFHIDGQAVESVAQRLEQMETFIATAIDRSAQYTLFRSGGSFENWTNANRPVGWNVSSLPASSIYRTTELPHSGTSSICIENSNQGEAAAWIQSAPIELPHTGRMAIRAWLRSSAADNRQPTVRMGLVGRRRDGQRYQRSVFYGDAENASRPLANDWGRRPAELHVSDVPIDDLVELQVAIDLIGPGKIWVDDVEVVEAWLHPDERNYLRGQLLIAKRKLTENNPFPAEKIIRSPWNQYLSDLQQTAPEQRTAQNLPVSHENPPPTSSTQSDRPKSAFQQWRASLLERWRR